MKIQGIPNALKVFAQSIRRQPKSGDGTSGQGSSPGYEQMHQDDADLPKFDTPEEFEKALGEAIELFNTESLNIEKGFRALLDRSTKELKVCIDDRSGARLTSLPALAFLRLNSRRHIEKEPPHIGRLLDRKL